MKTPREKYDNDPEYRHLVNSMEHLIRLYKFTPSELREASILASINYEMSHIKPQFLIDPKIEDACTVLDKFIIKNKEEK